MEEQLKKISAAAQSQITAAESDTVLDAIAHELFGRKQGTLTVALRGITELPKDERASAGAAVNTTKRELEDALDQRRHAISNARMANLADAEWIDVTAPGNQLPRGSVHPISAAIDEISAIFTRIGFLRERHPEVDTDYYAFEALNMPPDHPARDEWETFFVQPIGSAPKTKRGAKEERIVLTPHTSNGQIREMEKGVLPIRMVNIGRCYRRQIDVTHTPMFHQFEGLLVDDKVSVTHLKGTLDYFVASYFGEGRTTRLRPFHFRFTEPSFEIDISCANCAGSGVRRAVECRVCKGGWLELGGAGMVHPNVLRASGIDPELHSGFAFGWGVERVLMMKYGIDDIRLLYGNDARFLSQFS
jgi:phenylalanyl-tRNA synthetase alpha chain